MVIDEVHNRSAHSNYVLAVTLAVMQKTPDLRLVLMSATGDHNLVRERIPYCQQHVMKGAMRSVRTCFLAQPLDRTSNLLNKIAQIVINYHNERAGQPLVDETCHSKGVNQSNKIMVFLPGLAQIYQFCVILQRALDLGWTEMLIPLPFLVRVLRNVWKLCLPIQQCLRPLGNALWDRTRAFMILLPFGSLKLHQTSRRYGLRIVSQDMLDHALYARMLLSRVSLFQM